MDMAWTVVCRLCTFCICSFVLNCFLTMCIYFCSFLFLERWLSWLRNVSCAYLSRLMTKPTKWHVHPMKTQISLDIRAIWSVFVVRTKKAWVLSYPLSAQRRLIRMGGCPRWSETSLGAESFWWFCHEAAHLFWTSHKFLCFSLLLDALWLWLTGSFAYSRQLQCFVVFSRKHFLTVS